MRGLGRRKVLPVNEAMFRSEKLYQSTLATAQAMLAKAIITPEEFVQIRDLLIKKYHPPISSLSPGQPENLT